MSIYSLCTCFEFISAQFSYFISVNSKIFQINRGYPTEKLIFGHPDEFIRPDMYIRPCVHEHADIFSKGDYAKPKILKILSKFLTEFSRF